jgi:RimJ/RimL family protein N-acetyltransferase
MDQDSRRRSIRLLWRADLDDYREHLLRLDPQTRRDRFSGAVADAFLERYAEQAFREDRITLAYVVGGEVRGVAELCPFAHPYCDEGEAAFSVETPYRLRGIGTALFRRLILLARNRGIRKLHVRCLPHNRAMQVLARRHGARLVFEHEEAHGKVDAGLATPLSVFQEWAEMGFDFAAGLIGAPASPSRPDQRLSDSGAPDFASTPSIAPPAGRSRAATAPPGW